MLTIKYQNASKHRRTSMYLNKQQEVTNFPKRFSRIMKTLALAEKIFSNYENLGLTEKILSDYENVWLFHDDKQSFSRLNNSLTPPRKNNPFNFFNNFVDESISRDKKKSAFVDPRFFL